MTLALVLDGVCQTPFTPRGHPAHLATIGFNQLVHPVDGLLAGLDGHHISLFQDLALALANARRLVDLESHPVARAVDKAGRRWRLAELGRQARVAGLPKERADRPVDVGALGTGADEPESFFL